MRGCEPLIGVVMAFRDCGPLGQANRDRVVQQWLGLGATVEIVDAGSDNRFAAYNQAGARAGVLIFAEPDVLISSRQIRKAITTAAAKTGLVVPFRQYQTLLETQSRQVRDHKKEPVDCVATPVDTLPAIHILSRATMDLLGRWDDLFEGWRCGWAAMRRAAEVCAGPTRWVDGPAYQLFRPPREESSGGDKDSRRIDCYRQAKTAARVRELIAGGW